MNLAPPSLLTANSPREDFIQTKELRETNDDSVGVTDDATTARRRNIAITTESLLKNPVPKNCVFNSEVAGELELFVMKKRRKLLPLEGCSLLLLV